MNYLELEATIAKLGQQVQAKDHEIRALKMERDNAVSARVAAETRAAEAEAKAIETEKGVDKRANMKALMIECRRGVSAPISEEYRENPASDKQTIGELFGKEKVKAAFREQLARANGQA